LDHVKSNCTDDTEGFFGMLREMKHGIWAANQARVPALLDAKLIDF
jgi:hypothetical protein